MSESQKVWTRPILGAVIDQSIPNQFDHEGTLPRTGDEISFDGQSYWTIHRVFWSPTVPEGLAPTLVIGP